jgi:hypothetical protein
MEWSVDGTHRHIEGVCTADGVHHTRAKVAAEIGHGVAWCAASSGVQTRIRTMSYCPVGGCHASPYITTAPDRSRANNLDNLPPC